MVALSLPQVQMKSDLHLKLCLFPMGGQLVPLKMQPFHFSWALASTICCAGFPVVYCHDRMFEVMLQGILKNILFLISPFVGNLLHSSYISCLNIQCTPILPTVPAWQSVISPHLMSSSYVQCTEMCLYFIKFQSGSLVVFQSSSW